MSLTRSDQSIKPCRPELSLRERARLAHEAELDSEAAERADALARAQRNMAATLLATCQHVFRLEIDPEQVEVEIIQNASANTRCPNLTIEASVVVDAIRLSVSLSAADAARISGRTPVPLKARPLCPVCGSALTMFQQAVSRLADLGRMLGEVGCDCGWTPQS